MKPRPPVDVEPARADTTPMIDVVFLMIVFFVCLDFRTLEAKLPAHLPRDVGSISGMIEPEEMLAVRIHVTAPGTPVPTPGAAADGRPPRVVLRGHRVAWEVGPQRFDDLAAARRELARLAADPRHHVIDRATGLRRPMTCVVEGMRGTRYDDVAHAADACRAAGFSTVQFGGGMGPL